MQDEHEDERYEEQAKERQGCEGEERERYENQRLREVVGYKVKEEDCCIQCDAEGRVTKESVKRHPYNDDGQWICDECFTNNQNKDFDPFSEGGTTFDVFFKRHEERM